MDCNVISDLLPLYVDGCCTAESAALVAAHLKTCEKCRKSYEQMRAACPAQEDAPMSARPRRVCAWQASLLQSLLLFVSFGVLTLGVVLENRTPAGASNGLWAITLIVPATASLLSLANWFFLRLYPSRRAFSVCSCAITAVLIALGYVWAAVHYAAHGIVLTAPFVAGGCALSAAACAAAACLSNRYARLLGRE